MKKMNNKGFSLVELIIVIAIMAVLVGILAPQYLKYVNNSKVSTDISNAEQIATTINVAVSDSDTANLGMAAPAAGASATWSLSKGDTIYDDGSRVVLAPDCSHNNGQAWTVTWDAVNGVTNITLQSQQIWPDADAYTTAYKK